MKNIFKITIVMIGLIVISCEDIVHPELNPASPLIAVDAWINNMPVTQTIIITNTQPYFENTKPPGVSGASVSITDGSGITFVFAEDDKNPGHYLWTPPSGGAFGAVDEDYLLTIQVNGETFTASSRMGRVPPVDSVTFVTEKRIANTDSLTQAEFWATDPAGLGDAYWIRSFKNGVPLNKPSEINVAYDAGFSAGGAMDGVVFITPIRRGINPNEVDENDLILTQEEGDSMNVQIHSLTKEAIAYLSQVAIQTNRPGGFAELFATPLANVSTNILNADSAGPKALGFFNVSAVSSNGKRFVK